MNGVKRIARGTGKVTLAILAGILMPVLVWVALGAALNKKLREGKARQATAPTIGEIGEAVPKHCWEVLHCTPEKREACPTYARRDLPHWMAVGPDKGGRKT